MFYKIINSLKNSNIVKNFIVQEFLEENEIKILKIEVKLVNETILYITEVHIKDSQKYSYHWQTKAGELIMRWDNSPHWKDIPTFPHHKHIQKKVYSSARADIDEILKEIKNFIKDNKSGYFKK